MPKIDTTTATAARLKELQERADAATESAAAAIAAAEQAESELAARRRDASIAAQQAAVQDYDDAAVRQARVDAAHELRAALQESRLGEALLRYCTAVRYHQLVSPAIADTAAGVGIELPRRHGQGTRVGEDGKQLPIDPNELPIEILRRALYELTEQDAQAQVNAAVSDRVQAALAAVT